MFGGAAGYRPGSEPLITSAFMSIVPKDRSKVGLRWVNCKGWDAANFLRQEQGVSNCFICPDLASPRSFGIPRRTRGENALGKLLRLRLQRGQPCRHRPAVMGFRRIRDLLMQSYDPRAIPRGEGDHIHQGLHRLNRACKLITQDRIARTIDQRPVKCHVGGAKASSVSPGCACR